MKRFMLFLAFGTLGALFFASTALATHPRPSGGAQLRVPMAISFTQCVAPTNRFHGPALSAPSCNRGADTDAGQTSNWLTTGGGAAPAPAAAGSGFIKVTVCPNGTVAGPCSTPAGMSAPDVRLEGFGSQVLCKVGSPTQSQCSGGAFSTYNGELQGDAFIWITDHHNNTVAGGTGDTATVTELPFPVTTGCTNGTCSVVTRANAVVPGAVQPAKRANVQIKTIRVNDGGQAGVAGSPDATQYGEQGIFIP